MILILIKTKNKIDKIIKSSNKCKIILNKIQSLINKIIHKLNKNPIKIIILIKMKNFKNKII
jgi:hypothetical protein